MAKRIFPAIISIIILSTRIATAIPPLNNGIWRGTLKTADKEAPFLFEVKNSPSDSAKVVLINGEEKVPLTGIKYSGDSVIIPVEAFDAFIKARVLPNKLEGRFLKNYIAGDKGIDFTAEYNQQKRFEPSEKPVSIPIDGKWDVFFVDEKGNSEHNVGIFKTEKGIVTGSILTNSGDLRYLEGAYTTYGVQLSAFAGLSPYLFEFTFKDNNSFRGTFFTAHGTTSVKGVRNDKAGLEDPYGIAKLKAGKTSLGFSLTDLNGQKVSLNDERFRGKVVIVSLLGSWCPNCLDEIRFLAPWYEANKQRGVELVGLAFERKDDFGYAKGTLSRLTARYNITYPILFAGKAGAETIARVLPEIEGFGGYPTTFFIDKKGTVRKIHTGFSGPATGLFYDEFKKDFNELVNSLLAE